MSVIIKNAGSIEQPWTHWFLYGDSGSGKTSAAATFPRPLFLVPSNEGSIVTLMGRDIPYVEIVDKTSMNAALDYIEQLYASNPDAFPYDTIVVESLTHYVDLVVEELTQGAKRQMDQRGWGDLAMHLRTLQSRLRKLGVHAVFTSLAKLRIVEGTGIAVGGPSIQGSAAQVLPSSCDVVGYCETIGGANPRYRVHFRARGNYEARSRFRNLPAAVENFSFAEVLPLLTSAEVQQKPTNETRTRHAKG